MKYKLISIGTQWIISRVENGDSVAVGKIVPKPNNSIIFFFENEQISLSSRVVGENIFFSIKANELILKCNFKATQKQTLLWKPENKSENSYKCTKHKELYYLKSANQTLAKLKEISSRYFLLKLNQTNKLSNATILACFFPFLS
ncbi:MAG: hypothetical protein FK730_08965 [Asgard group archaeon]|nr:hypothetical protein [Asgard group archaeon]